jgi:hypothetical protein
MSSAHIESIAQDGLEAASIGVAGDWRRCGYHTTFDSAWYRYPIAVMEAKLATKIAVELEDDLDGGPADETVRFGLDGSEYEIDLNKKNARAFRKQAALFVDHARKAGRGQRRRSGRTTASRGRSSDIRAWAKGRGIPLSARGRIPASVAEQYEAATKGL